MSQLGIQQVEHGWTAHDLTYTSAHSHLVYLDMFFLQLLECLRDILTVRLCISRGPGGHRAETGVEFHEECEDHEWKADWYKMVWACMSQWVWVDPAIKQTWTALDSSGFRLLERWQLGHVLLRRTTFAAGFSATSQLRGERHHMLPHCSPCWFHGCPNGVLPGILEWPKLHEGYA